MKYLAKSIVLFGLACLLISCSNDSNNSPNLPQKSLEFQKLTNVSYGVDSDQIYDIYLPENRTSNTKIMILVHGGGWSSGDKSSMNYLVDLYRNDFPDLALVNINYRLSDENNPPYPMQIDDITTIINQLKSLIL